MTSKQSATVLAAYQHAEQVAKASADYRQAEGKFDAARAKLHAEIAAARAAGVRPTDLVRLTGFSSEYLRQIVLKAKKVDDGD